MSALDRDDLIALESGTLHSFADWPNPEVPRVACGVYTVWLPNTDLLYVGMSGRDAALDPNSPRRKGLWTRLNSHASGRRSGDQFCVYVCDRLIVPHLTPEQQHQICIGVVSLDALTRDYIQSNLSYRFVVSPDGANAFAIERAVQGGALRAGKPLLNPTSEVI